MDIVFFKILYFTIGVAYILISNISSDAPVTKKRILARVLVAGVWPFALLYEVSRTWGKIPDE